MTAILFLHGGGHADHTRYTDVEEYFRPRGFITRAFDHHADTLAGRLTEAERELELLKSENNLRDNDVYIWGSSMGGHIACRLTEAHGDLKGVVLQSAAAYSRSAETAPFGLSFTAEITREDSWAESPAFTAIESYPGPVLTIYWEREEVIPAGVVRRYTDRAQRRGRAAVISGSGHSMLRPVTEKGKAAWEKMCGIAGEFISG